MTTTRRPARVFGSGIRRREDPRLLTGTARYTADFTLPGMVHAAILRSPHGHARIRGVDTSRATGAAGVVAVFTGADTEAGLKCIPCAWLLPECRAEGRAVPGDGDRRRPLRRRRGGRGRRRTDYQAYDALDLIEVEYEPLPAVVDPQKAAAAGAPQLHAEAPGNVAFHWAVEGGDVDGRVRSRPTVVVQRSDHPAAADSDGDGDARRRRAVHAGDRRADALEHDAEPAHRPLHHVAGHRRARGPAARRRARSGRRLRQQDRADPGRLHHRVLLDEARPAGEMDRNAVRELPVDDPRPRSRAGGRAGRDARTATILGIRSTVWAGMGAYLSTAAPGIPTILHGLMLSGPYNVPAVKEDVYGVYTNTTPVEAYRGAGRPEATFMLERHARPARAQAADRSGRGPAAQSDSRRSTTATTWSPG